eukprot:CAMPEP_0184741946 /NCGR_PEP_ID=MMETSP0315-20130426/4943_1 /TAXON_ID=101924 /ORGANISM="Rhodosorus marinus, Strain UTEX LB 2760" /LENGTH=184 /DNA_ID=CAMNT_0027212527 /DNA_START=245 /DNA_END=799 /DNA_ORIENTATION=+
MALVLAAAGFMTVGHVYRSLNERNGQRRKAVGPCAEDLGLTCSVCLEDLCLPKVLPCGHSLCLGCAVGLLSARNMLDKCPVCRKKISKRVDQLPYNYSLINCIEKLLELGSPTVVEQYRDREKYGKYQMEKYKQRRTTRKLNPIKWVRLSLLVAAELGGLVFTLREAINAPSGRPREKASDPQY